MSESTGQHQVPEMTIEKRLAELERRESERKGAVWLASAFGGLLSIALVGAFGWTWTTNTELVRSQSEIERLETSLNRLDSMLRDETSRAFACDPETQEIFVSPAEGTVTIRPKGLVGLAGREG